MITTVGLAVAVMMAGIAVWAARSVAAPDLLPVDQALVDLASASGLQYRVSLPGGLAEDLKVTAGGEALGTVTSDGLDIDLLLVGGKIYAKYPAGLLPSSPGLSGLSGEDFTGKWVTGASGLPKSGLSQAMTPTALALTLLNALQQKTTTVSPAGTVNGVPALHAHTTSGDVYVSQSKPYRVLRYNPDTVGIPPSTLPSLPGLPTQAAETALTVRAASGPGDADITPMSLSQASKAYGSIEADTSQLAGSVNADIHFSLHGSATVQCSAGGCTVGATVSDSYITGSGTQVTGGQVTASMTGTITINGLPGGSCTATATFPAHDTGSMSCYDPEAGAVWQEAQAAAEEQASSSGATSYDVRSTAEVSVYAQAMVQAEVRRLITQERLDEQDDICEPGTPSTGAYAPGAGPRLVNAVHPADVPDNCGRFVTNSQGETIDLATPTINGVIGPTKNGKGMIFSVDPRMGLNPAAAMVRLMLPQTRGTYKYPNGYVSYLNKSEPEPQTVDPLTGQANIQSDNPLWHIPMP